MCVSLSVCSYMQGEMVQLSSNLRENENDADFITLSDIFIKISGKYFDVLLIKNIQRNHYWSPRSPDKFGISFKPF